MRNIGEPKRNQLSQLHPAKEHCTHQLHPTKEHCSHQLHPTKERCLFFLYTAAKFVSSITLLYLQHPNALSELLQLPVALPELPPPRT